MRFTPAVIVLCLVIAVLVCVLIAVLLWRRRIAAWLSGRMGRSAAARRRAKSGIVRAIVDVEGETIRVRGRVRTIRPVRTPDGDLVAGFRVRRAETSGDRPIAAAGRFAVDDGTGLALVDDSGLMLEPLDLGWRAPTLVLRDGDLVEVIGAAVRAPLSEADVAVLRVEQGATALVFEGRPDHPLLVIPLPLEASMAPPRSRAYGRPTRPGPHTLEHDALREVEAGGRAEAEARGQITGNDR